MRDGDFDNSDNSNEGGSQLAMDKLIDSIEENTSILLSSTMKKRRAKMNKHKLKKRSKKMRKNTKISRS